MQFSLADAESGRTGNKLLDRVIRQEHAALVGKLDAMVRAGQITPACVQSLLGHSSAMQFSCDGVHLVAFTLPQIVDVLQQTTIAGMGITAEQFSLAKAVEHPKGKAYTRGSAEPTHEEAEAVADQVWGKKKAS